MRSAFLLLTLPFIAQCLYALLRKRPAPKYPMNKTGFYKHSKNFER